LTKEQYIKTGDDESYTYPNLVEVILPFLDRFCYDSNLKRSELTIWCPFDLEEDMVIDGRKYFKSNYVKIFRSYGYKVIASHILTGHDFFEYEPKEVYDVIISNPPFKDKRKFFERALWLNKTFALVAPITWLNDGTPNKLFNFSKFSLIIPNRRAKFFNERGLIGKSPSFKSAYFCNDFTRRQLNFVSMEKEDK